MEKVKGFLHRLAANPVFWVALILCSLAGFITIFEHYTRLGAADQAGLFF